ncbi:hypothetical protein [Rhodohalobacter sulfatireducens]|uniref:Cytochrome oxidase subunit I profile domain-containing protein n=1 Tax=Rhodohalobacter sulfatireducens TaxID=2911366 RepID=A0ABS9KCK1_9BACT|nr:hypothetical protein [Rhodohalobacter sulfatireducens]MCG2588558.1 hypothetical protein [Rhodohalobacter sulfatireducens]
MKSINNQYNRIWKLSILSFLIAAFTGFIYRVGMLYPLPGSMDLVNIRHAHSHLMFFNWISPPIMVWMASVLAGQKRDLNHKAFKSCLYTMMGLGFLSYPFFLLYGYRSVSLGQANLPIAAIISGLIMITWYWFAWLYYQHRKRKISDFSLNLFDGALTALLISSLGAWGVSVFQFSGIHNPLFSSALTHFFLAVFTEGWALLGVMGIIWNYMNLQPRSIQTGWLWQPLLIGSILIFPFSLTQSLVTPIMLLSAKVGLGLIILSFVLHLYIFLKSKKFTGFVWKTILVLIGLKILFQAVAALPIDLWPAEHGLRILYLHLILLGIVSISMFKIFSFRDHSIVVQIFTVSVVLVIGSLFLISGYSPNRLTPDQPYQIVMYIAFLPVFPAAWILLRKVSKG